MKGVSQTVSVYRGLSALMLLLFIFFGLTWVATMCTGVTQTLRRKLAGRLGHKGGSQAKLDPSPQHPFAQGSSVPFVDNPLHRARRLAAAVGGAGGTLEVEVVSDARTGAPQAGTPPPPPHRSSVTAAGNLTKAASLLGKRRSVHQSGAGSWAPDNRARSSSTTLAVHRTASLGQAAAHSSDRATRTAALRSGGVTASPPLASPQSEEWASPEGDNARGVVSRGAGEPEESPPPLAPSTPIPGSLEDLRRARSFFVQQH